MINWTWHTSSCVKNAFPSRKIVPNKDLASKNRQWVTSDWDWDWPEECLLPRLICSYQDLTLASDELGDFVVRAGAGAGSPQMAGSEGEGWDVGVRRGRWNTCAFLPCKVRCRIPVFVLRRWSTAIFIEWCRFPAFAQACRLVTGIAWACTALCFEVIGQLDNLLIHDDHREMFFGRKKSAFFIFYFYGHWI